jgi:hypothetical protein
MTVRSRRVRFSPAPGRRAELMEKINSIYGRDHAIHVTLSDQEIAIARMQLTHEDDLPQA